MITPKIYIDANAPTVAEGAIRGAYWYGVNPYQTIEKSIDHATQYAVPSEEYRGAILHYMEPALASPEGLAKLIKRNGWHSPGPEVTRADNRPQAGRERKWKKSGCSTATISGTTPTARPCAALMTPAARPLLC